MKKILAILSMVLLFSQSSLVAYGQEVQKADASDETIEKQVDEIMSKYVSEKIPGASIGIVKDGKVILSKGYGVSNTKLKTPVSGDTTVFEVGSITKLFTWSTLMRLAEEGKVNLDTDIQEYLPEGTLNLSFDKKITILDLMNHTAGFEEKIEGIDLDSIDQLKPLKEIITKKNQPKQIYEPGTVTSYSNYGANLGGYIIEQVTGQNYTDYMNQEIHNLLKMKNSTFSMMYNDQPIIKNNLSLGYEFDGSSFKKVNRFLGNDVPAGALLSTSTDMTHFLLALLNQQEDNPYNLFKEKKTLNQLESHSYSMVPETLGNAHGFWEKEIAGNRIIEHGGNTEGFTSQISLDPENQRGYVLLTNVGGEATGLRKELETLLYGETTSTNIVPKKSTTDSKLVGRFRTARVTDSTMAKLSNVIMDSDIIITENKNGGINVKLPGETVLIHYVEKKTGVYAKVENNQKTTFEEGGLDLRYLFYELKDDESVFRIGVGTVTDFLPVTVLNTPKFNLMSFALSLGSLLVSLIYLCVRFIRGKRKQLTQNWTEEYQTLTCFSIIGLLVWGNVIHMILKFATDPTMAIDSMRWLFYINWLLPLGAILLFIYLVIKWRKFAEKKLAIFLLLISMLTTIVLYNVHLFF